MKIGNLLRLHLNIRRELPISKASRMYTGELHVKGIVHIFSLSLKSHINLRILTSGPQVQGCKPVLVTFESFKVGHQKKLKEKVHKKMKNKILKFKKSKEIGPRQNHAHEP